MPKQVDRQDLRIYSNRLRDKIEYRLRAGRVLISYFSQWIPASPTVLDRGAGYCEFINSVPVSLAAFRQTASGCRLETGVSIGDAG